jgi:hypothetical protein
VDGGLGEAVGGYQIDDAIPLTEEPVTADIDAAPTQDTAEPQTEAPEAPVKDIAPAQDTALERTRPQDTLSPNRSAAAAVAGTQVDDAPATYLSPALGGPVATPLPLRPIPSPSQRPTLCPLLSLAVHPTKPRLKRHPQRHRPQVSHSRKKYRRLSAQALQTPILRPSANASLPKTSSGSHGGSL